MLNCLLHFLSVRHKDRAAWQAGPGLDFANYPANLVLVDMTKQKANKKARDTDSTAP
jgi:hypothetical protein